MIEFAIGLGIFFNLLTYEMFGLTAGGAVVPGYLALFLDQPGRVVSTVIAAAITLLIVRGLSKVMIVYGRRKFALMLLVGFLVNGLFDWFVPKLAGLFRPIGTDLRVIGFIVPGLMANEMHDQGEVTTVAVTVSLAVLIRLAMMIALRAGVFGGV